MTQPILRTAFQTTAPAGELFKWNNPKLSVPCAVALETLTEDQVVSLVQKVQDKLGAKLFRDIELFMLVYRDHKAAVDQPYNWIYHVYLRLVLRPDGVIRITADTRPFGKESGGGTIYDLEQFNTLLDNLSQ